MKKKLLLHQRAFDLLDSMNLQDIHVLLEEMILFELDRAKASCQCSFKMGFKKVKSLTLRTLTNSA